MAAQEAQRHDSAVTLSELERDGRSVAYATIGTESSAPVIVFYAAGGSRRFVALFHEALLADPELAPQVSRLRFIGINRPGRGATAPPAESGELAMVETTCLDALAVLDRLGVQKASLIGCCAGTPYALAFAARHPERTTGRVLTVGAWVSPADFEGASSIYRLGSALPAWLVAPLVGTSFTSGPALLGLMPQSWLSSAFRGKLCDSELLEFDQRYPVEGSKLLEVIRYQTEESGGQSNDVGVLLASFASLGFDYDKVQAQVTVIHGDGDALSPIDGAEWLAQRLPRASLKKLNAGTHDGALFMLHKEARNAVLALAAK